MATDDPRVDNEGVHVWRRSTSAWMASTFGVGALSLLLGSVAFLPVYGALKLVPVATAAVGLILAIVGLHVWRSAGWARKTVAHERTAGKLVWPVRADGGINTPVVFAVVSVGDHGLAVTTSSGSVEVEWADITRVEALKRGILGAEYILIEGERLGHAEVQVLQPNAASQVSEEERAEFVEHVRSRAAGTKSSRMTRGA